MARCSKLIVLLEKKEKEGVTEEKKEQVDFLDYQDA
jgi:hypothetical protein